ncbi:hypothetical protein HKCCE2091_21620 [Rhodobacterales bacterium HKCCE2091]|nr:hypothetical protein [Rhodobacterales bacterium HKCCE2091]
MRIIRNLVAALAVALAPLSASAASMFPEFILDTDNSTIDITLTQGCLGRLCSNVGLTADFAAGADAFAWTPTGPFDSVYEHDFIDWTASGIGVGFFNVVVDLAFSAPSPSGGSTSGQGGVGSLLGIISGGVLTWNGPLVVSFDDGSVLEIYLQSDVALGIGSTTTTGALFVGNAISPIPVPAAGVLLFAALGGLAVAGRRRAAA